MDNLFESWREFKAGKIKKEDVRAFGNDLRNNLYGLHHQLETKTYRHSDYTSFYITDPKRRHIHKAEVRDRVVHHAVYRILYPIFDKSFIFDSYSCRLGKGTHRAVKRLGKFCRKEGKNYTKNIFALKCDIKKFFDNIDRQILLDLLKRKIEDENTIWLLEEIISSFHTHTHTHTHLPAERGIPIGNLTSQLFANVYLHELDQFIKHKRKIKYYLRYCDDFVILSENENYLQKLIPTIADFLESKLKLQLHPKKVAIRKFNQGIDFLGYVVLPRYIILRTKTKRRMLKRVNEKNLSSYLGLLKHCEGYELEKRIKERDPSTPAGRSG